MAGTGEPYVRRPSAPLSLPKRIQVLTFVFRDEDGTERVLAYSGNSKVNLDWLQANYTQECSHA